MTDTVLVETRDRVRLVTLNRPDRYNAMTDELLGALVAALDDAATDDAIGAVVVTGAGKAFCAGGDLGAIDDFRPDLGLDERTAALRELQRASLLLHDMPKATIAAVNGPCAGAGLALACAADLRFATRTAVFKTSFLGVTLTGDFGGTWSLPRIVGWGRARELYLLDERVDATRALAMGLVSGVEEGDGFLDAVLDRAHALAAAPANTVAGIKANFTDGETTDFATALDAEAVRQVQAVQAAIDRAGGTA
ncbi:enoyl-CoA hydratase [Pseudonocardia sulfidoxydans NBRC 16205]|uniref:Enoyl-CoA hydratase n=1 Tax=Pseudonocardia sulfidoxydans NBRC 16205 TaxID=1223511 RepID=A0A511DKH9_9PSEU|nr:enoyl-CoA hydratase-related protein [Pseudonocardia sulfidoxydans]GEL25329.1 enoyl-CoA hydratase [Pseudonocardia sulfidoxydans NBRC 16205]